MLSYDMLCTHVGSPVSKWLAASFMLLLLRLLLLRVLMLLSCIFWGDDDDANDLIFFINAFFGMINWMLFQIRPCLLSLAIDFINERILFRISKNVILFYPSIITSEWFVPPTLNTFFIIVFFAWFVYVHTTY